jgi:hypothetical protein
MQRLAQWYRSEYARRTKAVKAGTAPIDWLAAGYRVTWTEVVAKAEELGIDTSDITKLRRDFEEAKLTRR